MISSNPIPGLSFTAIDFETANPSRASACAVGMAKVRDGQIVDEVSEQQIDLWVAEAGYSLEWLKKRMGRPARADEASKMVSVCMTDAELAALMARGAGASRSVGGDPSGGGAVGGYVVIPSAARTYACRLPPVPSVSTETRTKRNSTEYGPGHLR